MIKAVWFQLHWLLGITAGIVLAIVGVTGGMLSFEDKILDALNPGVRTVTERPGGLLAPDALLARVRANAPERTVTAVTVSTDPARAARVVLAPLPGQGGGPRGETRYVDPYDGAMLGDIRGLDFFRTTMQIHRWLAAGDVGKQIVGASTVALIVLSLTGLYLRWPRRMLNWRAWFALDIAHRGRSFLWELHSVIGTWVLPFYLLAALTGLYWSYDWYRSALFDLTGTPRPQQMRPGGPPPQAAQGGPGQGAPGPAAGSPGQPAQAGQGGRPQGGQSGRPQGAPRAALDIAALWPVFLKESGGFSTATLRLPQGNAQSLTISYQPHDPAHERANNTLVLDAAGTVREHRRYDDLPAGQKLMGSIFVLHSGAFFGLPGLILMMLASLVMPLFAITGWMLYLDRRKKKAQARAAARALPATPIAAAGTDAPVLVAFASQTGTAERLAWQSAGALQAAGLPVTVAPLASLAPDAIAAARRALFVVSTFGEGEAPDAARGFARRMAAAGRGLDHLDYGLLALGDRAYPHFCGFGQSLDAWLRTHGATPLFDRIEVDGEDPGALRHWQAQLGALSGLGTLPDWVAPRYEHWRLLARRCLNPGSSGLPTFHVALAPADGPLPDWRAGDIVEIGPRNGPAAVEAVLARHGLDGAAAVVAAGQTVPLRDVLARSLLPAATVTGGAQALADSLAPLPHREYSIASIPADGRLELVIRQTRNADSSLGIGSGWLTAHATEGETIDLRIRANPGFHGPDAARPMILIGNGTGLAGLRAHLKARIHGGGDRNWLLFGERNAAHDFYFRDEITAWQSAGALARLDLAFSRDQNARIYVQDRLRAAGADVAAWLKDGAAIYVCGSLKGMAPAVDQVLTDLIGAPAVEALAEERRYCRDVY
ncbi:sulfite reductase flavoprotein subunit alpha [Aquabacter spiritensis]|uniref:Sulfite reductase (NADPH) flavoprotein alpha-component n=1 Tax=Aquabacter spiritensis TaxID=933073 RepID=A0A4R3LY21_9HYPH|nr:sulfite reductase flavoprotein subunit alpha [Aquabacter spiritensis]TCT04689.1 sulfite reductase (NADPH) flavoprotein alpha-component [Aquabacter spiritensis]